MISNDDYMKFTRETAIYPQDRELEYLTLGLASEAGEVAGKLKKVIRDNNGTVHEVQQAAIVDEMSDVAWYLVRLCDHFNMSLDELLELNYRKLSARKANNTISGSGDKR